MCDVVMTMNHCVCMAAIIHFIFISEERCHCNTILMSRTVEAVQYYANRLRIIFQSVQYRLQLCQPFKQDQSTTPGVVKTIVL